MNTPQSDFSPLSRLMSQEVIFHAVVQCVRLKLFDALSEQPATPEEIARKFGFQLGPTQALLELLAVNDLLTLGEHGYENTATAAEFLVSDSYFYQGAALEHNSRFTAAIKTQFIPLLKGEANPIAHAPDDAWSDTDTMRATLQHSRMGALQDTVKVISGLPNFTEMRFMADIGGNHGEYSMALIERNPQLHGVILDLPGVVEKANERIARHELTQSLKAQVLDLRSDTLPSDSYDLVIASHILYAFMDDLAGFARQVHDSLKPGGWFVSQHMNRHSDTALQEKASLEFVTRMSGYPTHFIAREQLESAFAVAGFADIRCAFSGPGAQGLIVAGQRDS
ncbi:2-polyprenyl-3-methyl-5-hydroxy-6-metoxy-1,4-benzoquinol methylase [Desulfobaculum xiamenense]|uniref:2-polyprenyl-3-methyl-5-hydroxy-6-metoxy-1, 4-benzoquinol methylase n=1 Tax=Desulfobaculum xiamenense TaxID=995050 RepID=A0A846QS07_9BACT|nr:methyltransferase [Desulfobaculum xiamenense]NJB69153.1 2-polyprenyl-3-methyl-5-hydroxy-6-metoxy-1,4-benzoquinol methylase [Desulfobaculum xiamenense]